MPPAPASSTNDAAICVTANAAQAPVGARRHPHAAVRQANAAVGGSPAKGASAPNASSTDATSASVTPTQSTVASTVTSSARNRVARRIAREHADHRLRNQHAERRARTAQQQALGEQRPAQGGRAGAERGANRQLAFAPDRPRAEDQVGDVRARDDEDQRRCRQQHEQNRSRRRRNLIRAAGRRRCGSPLSSGTTRDALRPSPCGRCEVRRAPVSSFVPGASRARRCRSSGARALPPSWRTCDAGWSRGWR